MMASSGRHKGARGETIAAEYLQTLGYVILYRNLQLSHLEIDLICRDGDCLVFVEVKNSPSGKYGHPATWIDETKKDRLRQAALRYLQEHPSEGMDIRFDVVTIQQGEIELYRNAF